MDAQRAIALCVVLTAGLCGASYRTENFLVTAPTQELAQQIGDSAERYRKELAQSWLGHELPRWSEPCPIEADAGEQYPSSGVTTFVFSNQGVHGWQMSIQGSQRRLLDSVLPHEITHTVFATHFLRPVPRWADEGACSTVEHPAERKQLQTLLIRFLKTQRGIAFGKMFRIEEYPADKLPLYAQGHSLASYLVQRGGRRKFVKFLEKGMDTEDWSAAVEEYYASDSLKSLQNEWLTWVRQGSPAMMDESRDDGLLAQQSPGNSGGANPNTGPFVALDPATAAINDAVDPAIYERDIPYPANAPARFARRTHPPAGPAVRLAGNSRGNNAVGTDSLGQDGINAEASDTPPESAVPGPTAPAADDAASPARASSQPAEIAGSPGRRRLVPLRRGRTPLTPQGTDDQEVPSTVARVPDMQQPRQKILEWSLDDRDEAALENAADDAQFESVPSPTSEGNAGKLRLEPRDSRRKGTVWR